MEKHLDNKENMEPDSSLPELSLKEKDMQLLFCKFHKRAMDTASLDVLLMLVTTHMKPARPPQNSQNNLR